VKVLEKYFNYYKDALKKPIALETGFHKIIVDNVKLTGKIDKIELISKKESEKEKPEVKVIDYKTMQPASRNVIMGKTKNSKGDIYRQLIFYKLLSLLDKNFNYDVKETEIDFVKEKNGHVLQSLGGGGKFKKESFEISQKETEELLVIIKDVIKKIKNLEFSKTEDTRYCMYCDYEELCNSRKTNS